MGLFNFGKKKAQDTACCECACTPTEDCCTPVPNTCCGEAVEGICCIKVLGAGCKSCHEQLEYAKTAVKNLGLDVEVEYITDMEQVMKYGVMTLPGVVVNEQLITCGKAVKPAEVEKLLKPFLG